MDKKIGMALIGCGRIGESHIDGIHLFPNIAELVAVMDIDPARSQTFGKRYGVPAYNSLEELFSNPEVEAVILALPHSQHMPVTLQAARAGRHILVEKVMANNISEARKMVEVCEANNVTLMVAQSRRYFYALQEARKRRSEIGQTLHMVCNSTFYFNKNIAPPWWKSVHETGGLVLTVVGCHWIDYALWFMDDQEPFSVYAEASSFNPDFEGPDEISVIVRFKNNALATFIVSINSHHPRFDCYIIGSKGTMDIIHSGDHKMKLGTSAADLYLNKKLIMSGEQHPHNMAVQIEEFARSILEKREPLSSGKNVMTQIHVLEAAKASAIRKVPIILSEFNEDVYVTKREESTT